MQVTTTTHGCVTVHLTSSRCASRAETSPFAGYHTLVTRQVNRHLEEKNLYPIMRKEGKM
jgi:hypothetical protein